MFDVFEENVKWIAVILMVAFLCVEGIVLLNLFVSILGDEFQMVKQNEKAIRLYRFALFTYKYNQDEILIRELKDAGYKRLLSIIKW